MTPSRRVLVVFPFLALPMLAAEVNGIKNFDKVNDQVYRGGQPSAEGWKYLAGIGVKVVIDLRETDSRAEQEQRQVTGAGMRYINVPMTGLTPPTEAEITKVLAVMEDANSGRVFVHCKRGADRTGAVIAAYHIDHDHWDNQRALKDAKAHHMSFFQFPRQQFIRSFKARSVIAGRKPGTSGTADAAAVAAPATQAAASAAVLN